MWHNFRNFARANTCNTIDMTKSPEKKIAAISMVRNDSFFTPKWIDYYGSQFGFKNLYLVLDGHDQPLPSKHEQINIIHKAHEPMGRAKGDRYRARLISGIAKDLFNEYSVVIAHDIDEFLVIDPAHEQSLAQYLQNDFNRSSLSALGLDVGQHLERESQIDASLPFLKQRKYAHVSARYTKAVVATKPVRWGSGFHRVKGKNFHIDPNLYLFHFGMVDYEMCKQKISDQELNKSGWSGHFNRRYQLFDLILKKKPISGNDFFGTARKRQTLFRPLFAINKPGMLKEKPVVEIPERFRDII